MIYKFLNFDKPNLFRENRTINRSSEKPSSAPAEHSDSKKAELSIRFVEDRELNLSDILGNAILQKEQNIHGEKLPFEQLDHELIVAETKKLQKELGGLAVDGIIGKKTFAAFEAKKNKQETAKETKTEVRKAAPVLPVTPVENKVTQNAKKALEQQREAKLEEEIQTYTQEQNLNSVREYQKKPELHTAKIPDWLSKTAENPDNIRRIFIQNEFTNTANIQISLNQLGISNQEFADMMSDDFRIEGQGTNETTTYSLSANRLLQSTNFYKSLPEEQNFEEFLTTIENLKQEINNNPDDKTNPAKQAKLDEMFTVFNNIKQLLKALPELKHKEPDIISPDFIEEAKLDKSVVEKFKTTYKEVSTTELPFDFEDGNDRLTIVAILSQVYGGDVNHLRAIGVVKPWYTLNGTSIDPSENPHLIINDFGADAKLVAELLAKHPTIFEGNHSTDNLTEAILDLQKNDNYKQFTLSLNEKRTEGALGKINDNSLTNLYLTQLFPNTLNSPLKETGWFLNSQVEQIETVDMQNGKAVEGITQSNSANQVMSDPAMRNYLLSQISEYKGGTVEYNFTKLQTVLKELIQLGKARISESATIPADQIKTLQNLNVDSLLAPNRGLTPEEILLIREGLILKTQFQSLQTIDALEKTNDPKHKAIIEAIKQNTAIPESRRKELTQKTIEFLAGLKASGEILPHDLKIGVATDFILLEDKDGNVKLELSVGTTVTDFKQLAANGFTPVLGLQLTATDLEKVKIGGGINVGIATITGNVNAGFEFGNKWQLGLSAGGGSLLGIPVLNANIGIGQSFEARVNNTAEEITERMKTKITPAQITQIREGNSEMTDAKILELANQEPAIQNLLNKLPDSYKQSLKTNPGLKDKISVYFLKTYCQNIDNQAVVESDGIGWQVGLSAVAPLTGGLPILIPIVRLEFKSDVTTYYSQEIAASQSNKDLNVEIKNALESQLINRTSQSNRTEILTSENGLISYDGATGKLETTLVTAPKESSADITEEDTLNNLNKLESQLGINFELANETEKEKADYIFSINDLNDTTGFSTNKQFNIYSDPASGIILTVLDKNRIGVRFYKEGGLPPNQLAITRSEINNSFGTQNSIVSICFTTRATTPDSIINSTANHSYIEANPNTTRRLDSPYFNEEAYIRLNTSNLDYIEGLQFKQSFNFTPEEVAAGQELLNSIKNNVQSTEFEITPELKAKAEALIANPALIAELTRTATTNPTHQYSPEEFAKLITKHNNNIPATDAELMYLESILIPGTFLKAKNLSPEKRIQEMNRVTEQVMGKYLDQFLSNEKYNKNPEGKPFTDTEKAAIKKVLITDNLVDSKYKFLENQYFAELDTVLLTTAGNRRISGSQGYRQMRITNSNIQIAGEQKYLNLDSSEQKLAAHFIRNIIEPFPESIDAFGAYDIQDLFKSETTIKLMSLNFNYKETQLPMILALYGERGTKTLTTLYNASNDETQLSNELNNLTQEDKELVLHFFNLTKQIRNSTENDTKINLIPYKQTEPIGTMQIDIKAGTLFIDSCKNITLFYNFGFNAKLEKRVQNDIIAAKVQQHRLLNSKNRANTIGIGIAVTAPIDADSKSTKPNRVPGGRPIPEPKPEPAKPNNVAGNGKSIAE